MFRKVKSNIKSDFRKDIPGYTDDKIVEILKQRDYYQPEAAKLAIEEAIKRGIIFSEQDLFAEAFKVEELGRPLFPKIRVAKTQNQIRKSIARSLVICGVLPIVFGLVQSNAGNTMEGSLVLFSGLVWIFFAARLIKQFHKIVVFALLTEAVVGFAYIVTKLVLSENYTPINFLFSTVLFLLIGYGLFFFKSISEE